MRFASGSKKNSRLSRPAAILVKVITRLMRYQMLSKYSRRQAIFHLPVEKCVPNEETSSFVLG